MSEDKKKTYRLFKVSAELNVAIDTLADALRDKGFEPVDAGDPNAKITSDMYEFLVNKYSLDKQSKEKATRLKQAQKDQAAPRVRKTLQPLDEAESFDSSPLTAIELRQKLSQQAAEPVARFVSPEPEVEAPQPETRSPQLDPVALEPAPAPVQQDEAPPREPSAQPVVAPEPDRSAPTGDLELPPLPDFISKLKNKTAEIPETPAPVAEEAPPVVEAPPVPAAIEAQAAPVVETPAPAPVVEAPEIHVEAEPPQRTQATETPEITAPVITEAAPEPPQQQPTVETPQPAPVVEAPEIRLEAEPPAAEQDAPPTAPEAPALIKPQAPAIGVKVVGKVDLDQMDPRRKRQPDSKETRDKERDARKPAAKQGAPAKQDAKPPAKGGGKPETKSGAQPPAKPERPPRQPAATADPAAETAAPRRQDEKRVETPTPTPLEAELTVAATLDPAVPVTPEKEEEQQVIRASDHAPKLTGLKILGKIDLTADMVGRRSLRSDKDKDKGRPPAPGSDAAKTAAAAAADADKRKRKRKRKSAAPEATTAPNTRTTLRPTGGGGKPAGAGSKTGTGKTRDDAKKEVSSNLRNTLGAIGRAPQRKRQNIRKEKRTQRANIRQQQFEQEMADANVLEVTEYLTANELASLMDVSVNEVIAKCMELGMIVSINQRVNAEIISLIAEEFGYEVKFVSVDEAYANDDDEQDEPEDLIFRHPIVTVMGHVDHGKTSLLDYIRKTNVTKGEAGGITQHIGAYEVKLADGRKIAFLDTPGHEAFTAMRARGAQVTDIAIIVIAADDQVMPQTREAINHAQAAGVKMVFAINKIDKEGAKPEVIRQQLAEMNLLVEDWGGTYQCQEISAKKGVGIEELLEKVLLEAELLELKANPNRTAKGTVIEAQLDRGRGVVATLLVQNGTLNVGDIIVANCNYGRIKAMFDDKQKKIKTAGPSTPVLILGLDGVPQAGDKFQVMSTDREARELATRRQQLLREQTIRMHKNITLEEIARRSALGDFKELNVIVKGDVDGSVEALADSLIKLSAGEVAVKIIMKGVGEISESDVLLASASNAIIVGFQVRPSANARKLLQHETVDVRLYSVIYDAINEIRDALEGLLKPKIEEEVVGVAQVRDTFRVLKVGTIAGCMVTEGKINRNNMVRVIRDGIVQYTGKIDSLRRFKDDVREVAEGFECGISVENFNDIKVGDNIEAFVTKEIKRTIDSIS